MSRAADPDPTDNVGDVCDICGFVIDRPLKRCPAMDEGVCRP